MNESLLGSSSVHLHDGSGDSNQLLRGAAAGRGFQQPGLVRCDYFVQPQLAKDEQMNSWQTEN